MFFRIKHIPCQLGSAELKIISDTYIKLTCTHFDMTFACLIACADCAVELE